MPAPRTNSRTADEPRPPAKSEFEQKPEPEQLEEKPEPEPKAASGTAYLNVSGSPLVYDKLGHQVGAGEWTPEVNLDAIGQAARRAGHLKSRSAL